MAQPERLQKVMAAAGIGSRRECEELILAGRVEIDRQVVSEVGTRVDPLKQEIRLDGEVVLRQKPIYLALNKPRGVLCTNRDPSGRPRAIDLIPERFGRLFPVGRLDMNSQGLILLTNDGELANRIVHPRYQVPKVYQVQVAGVPERETIGKMRDGVYLADGFVRVASVKLKRRHKQSAILEMTLEEGRNREIRRILARLGHKVLSLTRVAVGPVRLGKLPEGDYRQLTRDELKELRQAVQ